MNNISTVLKVDSDPQICLRNPLPMADSDVSLVAKACSNCAKAKAKCDGTNTGRCQRCNRLGKDCAPQESIRKRKTPKIKRSDQIAQLQETVNGLLSIVNTSHQKRIEPPATSIAAPSTLTPASLSPSDDGSSVRHILLYQPLVSSSLTGPLKCPSTISTQYDAVPLLKGEDTLLSIFHDRLAVQIPFMVIPREMTAEELRTKRPLVYMGIMMAASYKDTATQGNLGNRILQYIAEHVIMKGEKSMDLLQGLLIYIFWYHYFLHVNPQMNNLLGLLHAQLVDLGLKRVSAENEVQETFIQITRRVQAHVVRDNGVQPPDKELTVDEKRAYLGCYYLYSCLTSSFSRLDSLRFSPCVVDGYEAILDASERSSDAKIRYLMRLQYLVEKQRASGLWDGSCVGNSDASRAPIGLLVRSYQMELQNFKNSLPDELVLNSSLALNYYSAEIYLYEVCFKASSSTSIDYSLDHLRFTDIIYACFVSTRSFFEVFLGIPSEDCCALTVVNIGHMFHAIAALYKLSVFKVDGWDVSIVRKALDLSNILCQLATRLEEAGTAYGAMEENSPWFFCVRKLKLLKTWWDITLAREMDLSTAVEGGPDGAAEDFQGMLSFDFLDDSFWQF